MQISQENIILELEEISRSKKIIQLNPDKTASLFDYGGGIYVLYGSRGKLFLDPFLVLLRRNGNKNIQLEIMSETYILILASEA